MGCLIPHSKSNRASLRVCKPTETQESIARTSASENFPPNIKCLKISIKPDIVQQWKKAKSIISTYAADIYPQCNYIFQEFVQYEEHLSIFEQLTHGMCINDFDLAKGLSVLLFYFSLNAQGSIKLVRSKYFPFISIKSKENYPIETEYQNFAEFMKFLERFTRHKDSMINVRDNILNYIKQCQELTSAKYDQTSAQIVKELNEYQNLADELIEIAIGCSKVFKELENRVDEFLDAAKGIASCNQHLKCLSIKSLVHTIEIESFIDLSKAL
jgi:hypothetical protein